MKKMTWCNNHQWHINPANFPLSCNCLKYARPQSCPCRIKHIAWSQFGNARRNNHAIVLKVVDELLCKVSLYRTFPVDISKKCVYLFGKNIEIAFRMTLNMNFSFLIEKR